MRGGGTLWIDASLFKQRAYCGGVLEPMSLLMDQVAPFQMFGTRNRTLTLIFSGFCSGIR